MRDYKSHHDILEMRIDVTSYDQASNQILTWSKASVGRYVCVANVHMCMEAFDNYNFCRIVRNADLVVPDGMPLVWGLLALGAKKATQVRGSNLLLHLCREAQIINIPIGLYGGTPDSLMDFIKFLKKEFPSLKIPFFASPPFRGLTQKEKEKYIDEIKESRARVLFVGIGCPKQELWMAEHRDKINCTMIGVGAAFDFFSGRKKHAPRWMQKIGLEWLFRLISDPKRLWKRYLIHNPRFVYHFGKQLFRGRVFKK
jgi:N-acetylglucosaminyldiphosphoundecaprenol N-acetyl-beta-D-mannosaminyltransferase